MYNIITFSWITFYLHYPAIQAILSKWAETVQINSSDEPYLNNISLIRITFMIKYIEIPPTDHNCNALHSSLSVLKSAGIYSTIPVVNFTT